MQWLLNNWHLLGLGSLGILGAASYFLGLTAVLRIVASIVEIITPLLRGLMEAIVEWLGIMWEGIKDIIDSWKTVITVVSFVLIAYLTAKVPAKIEQHKCATEKQELKKQIPTVKKPKKQEPPVEFRWPWE